jgi:hypothetical protein
MENVLVRDITTSIERVWATRGGKTYTFLGREPTEVDSVDAGEMVMEHPLAFEIVGQPSQPPKLEAAPPPPGPDPDEVIPDDVTDQSTTFEHVPDEARIFLLRDRESMDEVDLEALDNAGLKQFARLHGIRGADLRKRDDNLRAAIVAAVIQANTPAP